jgi:protein TonB
MSPLAAFMAAALHVATALVLFWVSPLNRHDLDEDPVEITMEAPAPQETQPEQPPVQEAVKPPQPAPTPPAAQAAPPPPPPAAATKPEPKPQPKPQEQAASDKPLGVAPPAPAKEEPPKPGGSAPEPKKEAAAAPQQEAAASPPPPPPPAPTEPPLEKVVPPLEAPPAPLTMRDFVKVVPPPVVPHPPQAAPQPAPQRPGPSPLQHSPLSPAPQPPSSSSASVSTFVNPADEAGHSRAKDAYLWQVIRKFSQYLPDLRDKNEGGTVVLRFSIARDGRLTEASIVKSSGVMALDKGLLESLRAASPYPPLPPEIPGDHVVFTQPIAARR